MYGLMFDVLVVFRNCVIRSDPFSHSQADQNIIENIELSMDSIEHDSKEAHKNVQNTAVSSSSSSLIEKTKTVGVGAGIGSLIGFSMLSVVFLFMMILKY
jgi:hypothetical protein